MLSTATAAAAVDKVSSVTRDSEPMSFVTALRRTIWIQEGTWESNPTYTVHLMVT
jgi:hypothetical protein